MKRIEYTRMIDLSLPLDNNTPVYPGDAPIAIEPVASMPDDYVNVLGIQMATHQGTHLDAPFHQVETGRLLNDFPLDTFFGPAVKIDLVPEEAGPDTREKGGVLYRRVVTIDDLAPHKETLAHATAVILHTGYGPVLLGGAVDKEFPILDVAAAEFLGGCESLRLFGIDSVTVDAYQENKAHLALFAAGRMVVLETLVNLEQVPDRFVLCCFPLAVARADGAPCRAVALC